MFLASINLRWMTVTKRTISNKNFGSLVSRLFSLSVKPAFNNSIRFFSSAGQYEPDYLEALGPQQPVYDSLNIQMKFYDYTVLEHYARHVHRTAELMGCDVEESWATPPSSFQIQRYKPNGTIVDRQYKLNIYERNVQLTDFPCSLTPVFLEVIQASLPEGVQLNVHEHEECDDDIRYIPDTELNALKTQLEIMKQPKKT